MILRDKTRDRGFVPGKEFLLPAAEGLEHFPFSVFHRSLYFFSKSFLLSRVDLHKIQPCT